MTDDDAIERRLSAVERAVSGGEDDLADVGTRRERDQRLADVEDRLDDLAETVSELDAATQALRGYVGNIRSVNRDVERRAEAALAAVDRLEAGIDETTGASESAPSSQRHDRPGHPNRRCDVDRSARDDVETPGGADAASNGHRAGIDELATGPEMPVPGASDGVGDPDRTDIGNRAPGDSSIPDEDPSPQPDDGSVFDRVRDVL